MEKYEPTQEEMSAAEEIMTDEQKAATERREEAREDLDNLKTLEVDRNRVVLVGKEKVEDEDTK